MKRGSVFLFLVLIIFFFCPLAYSDTLVFDLGSLLEGPLPTSVNDKKPLLVATFTDDPETINGQAVVKLVLDATNLSTGQNVSSWLFNFSGDAISLEFYVKGVDGSFTSASNIRQAPNAIQAGSNANYGYFDVSSNNPLGGGSDPLSLYIAYSPDLSVYDFNVLDSMTNNQGSPASLYYAAYSAAQINESWVATPTPTPEPATMLLLGLGLVGVALVGRKKFKK